MNWVMVVANKLDIAVFASRMDSILLNKLVISECKVRCGCDSRSPYITRKGIFVY